MFSVPAYNYLSVFGNLDARDETNNGIYLNDMYLLPDGIFNVF